MIFTINHYPMIIFNKQSVQSWQKRKRKNVTLTGNAKNVTMDTFYQSLVTVNTARIKANVTNERRIFSGNFSINDKRI